MIYFIIHNCKNQTHTHTHTRTRARTQKHSFIFLSDQKILSFPIIIL